MKTINKHLSLNEMANTDNRWAVITVNETYHWSTDIIKKAKKIECVYLVNLWEPTNLCELSVCLSCYMALRNFFP
jgi:hypothetical protein